ncbi:MAG: type II secretion system F family protein, partial [bacterium]
AAPPAAESGQQSTRPPISSESRPGNFLARINQIQLFESKKVTPTDLIFFTQQLALLLETGNSLVPSLSALSKQVGSPALKKVLKQVTTNLEEGADFSDSLGQHPEAFDSLFVSLVKAGEASGALTVSLTRITSILEVRRNLRSEIREAMAYPTVLMTIMAGTLVFMFTFIIPKFEAIFEGMGDDLPTSTRLLLGTGELIRSSWMIILPILIAAIVGLRFLFRTPIVRGLWDQLKLKLPLAGSLVKLGYLFQLFSTFGLLLGSRVPLLDTIGIARQVIRNVQYETFFARLVKNVEAGQGLAGTFAETEFLPETVKLMVSTGEQAGALHTVMERLATHYRQELESSIRRLSVVLEPALLVVMGIMVGFIAVSFIVPIFKMSRAVH